MSWLNKFLKKENKENKDERSCDQQQPCTSCIEDVVQPCTPVVEEAPLSVCGALSATVRELLKLSEALELCIFFDPEEMECFIYNLSEEGAQEFTKIPIAVWEENLPLIKSLNNRRAAIEGRTFGCLVSVSLTNLGERAALRLFREQLPGDEVLKEEKRKIIRWVNSFKPPTALTHNNIEHLLEMIESREGSTQGDLFALLREEGIFSAEELEELKTSGSIKFVLDRPVPRKQLVETLSRWMGVEYVDVEMIRIDEELARTIPETTAKSLNVLPFAREGDDVKVAFRNPFDENTLFTVNEYLGDRILPFLSCEEDIRYELEKLYT